MEQVLTQWIFDSDEVTERELDAAKTLIVETICSGLQAPPPPPSLLESPPR